MKRKRITVYDTGEEWADRYTVVIGNDVFGMSSNALQPNGINMWYGSKDSNLAKCAGKRVKVKDLPPEVQEAIRRRVTDGA